MGKIIFKYELADAWEDTLAKVEIADESTNNVRCIYPCVSHYVKNDSPKGKIYTLNEQQIKKIKNILNKNIDIFDINEVERPFVLDGYINKFYFSIAGLENEIRASNISIYRKDKSIKAKRILEVFDEITKVLSKNKIDRQFYKLDLG